MLFNVPQYVDVEDKIAGPLTGKQLLWMFAMAGIMLVLWTTLDKGAFLIAAIPLGIIFCALAFYKPNGQPLISYVFYGFTYLFSPKMYTWEREPNIKKKKKKKQSVIMKKTEEKIAPEDISALAETLDSDGYERSKRIEEIIRRSQQHKK